MIELKTKKGVLLQYDEGKDVVLVDGKQNPDWHPSFIEGGLDDPEFFGFIDLKSKKCYDIYGGVSDVIDEIVL